MRTNILICSAAIFVATSFPALAANSTMSEDFVKKAAMSDRFEIESSQLALEKSKNTKVKAFAQQMVDDHTKSTNDLKAALGSSEIDPGLTDTPLDAKHQKIIAMLKHENAKKFDTDYLKAQKEGHAKAVALFQTYAKKGDDASLKDFANKTLPVIEGHKKHVSMLKGM